MIAASGITALTGALVHQSAGPAVEIRGRHERFITHKLAVSFAVLAVAPFVLAFRGVPTPPECFAFVWGLLPLAVAVLVARTGHLLTGQAALSFGLVAFSHALVLAGVALPAAVAWLVLAQWEAAASADRRIVLCTSGLAGLSFATGLILTPAGSAPLIWSILSAGLATAYAITLSATGLLSAAPAPRSAAQAFDTPVGLVADAFGDLAITSDANGSVDQVAGNSERLLATAAVDLCGRGLFHSVHVADRPMFLKTIADAACGDELRSAVVRLRVPSQSEGQNHASWRFLWIELRARRIPDEVGARPRVLAILRDVSATHRQAPTNASAAQPLDATLRSRDDFLANMSHELRTPLNAIIGFSEMLGSHTLRPSEPNKQREYAQIIHQSGQHLLSVVNSILDMSKIRSGTFSILPEPFELRPLIDQCLDMMRLKALENGVTLISDCPADLEELVGDRRACKQIILNLLSNAVKFTPARGEVRVAARPEGTSVLLTVSDTGIGIGAEDLARVGDPFYQARSSLSRPFEGTGLGLSIVRGLVGLHGGTMTIESEPTLGTRVTARLPLDCQAIADRGRTAIIETIPRRSVVRTTPPVRSPSEPRIRSIA